MELSDNLERGTNIDECRQGELLDLKQQKKKGGKKFLIESYGCAMNFSDSEIVASILSDNGWSSTTNMEDADMVMVNTCSIREKAEDRIRKRLELYNAIKRDKKPSLMIAVLGCMAERLKEKLLEEEKIVDLVVGPDAYRDLPNLVQRAENGQKGMNVLLSREETYADISPMRLNSNGISAYISIMRGCDNMCSFCVVPFTRGRERSRNPFSIISEATDLFNRGYRDITLLGQNVDSFDWENPETKEKMSFAQLLELVAQIHPDLRIGFSTSHPKDITDEVLFTIKKYENIMNYIHLPVQSGNTRILELMKRTYTREWYIEKVKRIYEIIPDCAISSDMIAGFCSETEEEHKDTLSIMKIANYAMSFMFYYSERPNTYAAKKLEDNVPLDVKKRRLSEIIELQHKLSHQKHQNDIGRIFKVLISGYSKKSDQFFKGRNTHNNIVIFKAEKGYKLGDYAHVKITSSTTTTLKGEITAQI